MAQIATQQAPKFLYSPGKSLQEQHPPVAPQRVIDKIIEQYNVAVFTTGDLEKQIFGFFARYVLIAVVPQRGAPIMKKSGKRSLACITPVGPLPVIGLCR